MVLILLAARWLPLLRGGKETGRREVEILEQRVRERTEELERNREALVESQRIAHFGNWDWNIVTNGLEWSDEIYRIFGLTPQQFGATYDAFLETVHPEDREAVISAVDEALEKNNYAIDHRIVLPDGSVRTVHERADVSYDSNHKPVRMIGTVHDITEQKEAEKFLVIAHEQLEREVGIRTEELRRRNEELQAVMDSISEPIMVVGLDYRVQMMNRAAERAADGDLDSFGDKRCYRVAHGREEICSEGDTPCPLRRVIEEDGPVTVVHRHVSQSGSPYYVELLASPLRNRDGSIRAIVEVSRDITGKVIAEQKLQKSHSDLDYLAHHDPVTQLSNRIMFHVHLDHAINVARREKSGFAVLFLDLDDFKKINDSLGHMAGDELLQILARRFSRTLRDSDLIARFGGDEFAFLVVPASSHDEVSTVANKVLSEARKPFDLARGRYNLSASIGISLFPGDAGDVDTLIQHADLAMYHAKKLGGDRHFFYTREIDRLATERLRIEQELRWALEHDELEIWYQPLVSLNDGAVTGLEALLRWRHQSRGILLPSEFISVAEMTGLILPIGSWVIEQACLDFRGLLADGFSIQRVAVNLSVRQFEQSDFVDRLAALLEESGFHPGRLELELTESILMGSVEGSVEKLETLHEMGVTFAIDDFGTGYSSFDYLKRLMVDRVKIDASFVAGLEDSADDRAIVSSMISVAGTLGFDVTAEGVENETQKGFLRANRCDEIQGYLVSKPMPLSELRGWLQDFRKRAGQLE